MALAKETTKKINNLLISLLKPLGKVNLKFWRVLGIKSLDDALKIASKV